MLFRSLAGALPGREPAHGFSKFATGMTALTERLRAPGRPNAAAADTAEADAGAAAATYFAPNPGTA